MGIKEFWKFMITDQNKVKTKIKSVKRSNSKSTAGNKDTQNNHNNYKITESTSKRKLGKGVILFILINSILGSSLFYLPSLGVESSGPASILAWILIWMIAAFIMMYIGELLVFHPTSGGTYAFCKRAYGRFIPFIAGWLIWLTGNLGMALNVVAASEYFIPEPTQAAFILRIVFSLIWILVLNYMAFRGIDAGATMLVAFGAFSVVVVALMIIPSFISFPSLFSGAFASPFNSSLLHPFFRFVGFGGIATHLLLSLLFITEAFFGFEAVTYMANEAKEPHKLHKLLFTAMAICGVIVVIYILSSLGTVNITDYVNDARPFAVQALNNMGEFGQNIVVFGMYLVIIGASAAWPIAGSRLIQAMAKDKLFLRGFSKLHKKHKSPSRAVIFQTIAIILFTWVIFRGYLVKWGDPYRTTYLIYIVLSILALSIIIMAVPVLRKKEPKAKRPYKAPFPFIGPILIVGFYALLIINWIRFEGPIAKAIIGIAGSLVFLGIPLYMLIEMYYDPKAIIRANALTSYLSWITDKLFFAFGVRNKYTKRLGNIKDKKIIELGSGVGSLTKKLSKQVGSKGKIFALDPIKHNINITEKRTKRISNVSTHHVDVNSFNFNESVKVDLLISINTLSQIQNPVKTLKKISEKIRPGGEVLFIDYDKFFYLFDNIAWAEDNKSFKQIFKKAGFSVEVKIKRNLFWSFVIIKGKKV
jgi:basic amino acid/polyamine antiporter, APA family